VDLQFLAQREDSHFLGKLPVQKGKSSCSETSLAQEINVHITMLDVECEAELLFRPLLLDSLSTGDLKQTGQLYYLPHRDAAPWRMCGLIV
jgi:hypothetical protein